jgi:hypothetical protein
MVTSLNLKHNGVMMIIMVMRVRNVPAAQCRRRRRPQQQRDADERQWLAPFAPADLVPSLRAAPAVPRCMARLCCPLCSSSHTYQTIPIKSYQFGDF